MNAVSERTIGRLSLYRRLLDELQMAGASHVYSHRLAELAGATAAQVRRDLMGLGYTGSPARGYDIRQLSESIGKFIDAPAVQGVALVGVGNLGRAILAFFNGRRPSLSILAAFDSDPRKVNRLFHGCPCHPMEDLVRIVQEKKIETAIVAVPSTEAQTVTDMLVRAGVRGVENFAPAPLRVPAHVYVEDIDITTSLEKVAYFARCGRFEKETIQ